MVGKNNQYVKKIKQGTKVETYSIKKFKVGIASVAIGCSVFFGAGAVAMAGEQTGASVLTGESNTTVVPKGEERAITGNQSATGAQSNSTQAKEGKIEPEKPKATVNKAKLETLIKEVEGLNLEKYTEESVKVLKTELAKAKEVFETAQNKEEVEAAWRTLFTYKNSKLVVKKTPKLSQDNTPKPDTTNGKETVGINAENTEPNGTNIAGHNHSMNGTTRSEGSGFRATPEEVSGVEFGISNGQRDGNYSRTDRYFDTLSSNQYTRIFKFVSKSGNITSVTATSSTGRSVTLEKMDKFPNNATTYFVKAKTDVTGVSDAILSFTVKTAGGDKTAQIGVYRSLGKPTIKVPTGQKESTVDEYLKGKQKTTPTIDVEVPVVPNLPSYAKMKVYLVHDNDRDKGVYDGDEWAENHNPRPTRLTAKVEVPYGRVDPKTNKTTVTIQSGDYLKPLAEGKYFVLSVIEINDEMNTNPGIRASSFSDAATVAANIDRTAAIEAIKQAATAKTTEIDQADILPADKTSLKGQVESEKTKGINNVNGANDQATVNSKKNEAVNAIQGISLEAAKKKKADADLASAKTAAIEAINQAATAKTTEIDQADILPADKTSLKGQVESEKTKGINNVNGANDQATVNSKKNEAVNAIQGISLEAAKKKKADADLASAKTAAIEAINQAATAKTTEIDQADILPADKTSLKGQVESEKTKGINNVNGANDQATVNSKKNEAVNAIQGISLEAAKKKKADADLASAKIVAITEIKAALATKEKATDEDKALTKGQKTSIKEIAKKEAMAATVEIKAATTNKDVEEAKNEGIEKIKAAYARNAELAAELTLPKLIITKWQDEAGNDLRPADAKVPAEPGGTNKALAHGEIAGYEFVATRNAGEVVTHIFRKLPKKSPIIEERQLPVVENVNTKTVLPNTGANTTNTGLAGLGLAVFGGLLTVARQRRRNK